MSVVKVLVGGLEFSNFDEMRIYSDMYSLADTFSFGGVIVKGITPTEIGRSVKEGSRCVITINSKTVMSGYVTDIRLGKNHDTGTLFDFSGIDVCGWVSRLTVKNIEQGSFTPVQVLAKLREQIPAMKNITVSGIEGMPAMKEFSVTTGETAADIFNVIADRTNMIWYAKSDGTIIFGKKSKGGNYHNLIIEKDLVKNVKINKSIQDVYNEIVYIKENDTGTVTAESIKVPGIPDMGIKRYVRVDAGLTGLRDIAEREINDVISRYLKLNAEYAGFTDSQNKVWEINKPVKVSDNGKVKVYNGTLVIETVEFQETRNEGQTTNLTLTLPAAY